jgi:hypothetical protein
MTKTNNPLIDSPQTTVRNCRLVIDWLATAEQNFHSDELHEAESLMLRTVVQALEHAESVIER